MLKWVSDDTAWVDIDGHHLLALLQSRPPVGTVLTFVILQLAPDIILKELHGVSAGGSALNLAGSFETARTLFENQLRPYAPSLDTLPPEQRVTQFLDCLGKEKKLLQTFLDAYACLETINAQNTQHEVGQLRYTPWMLPMGRRHITLMQLGESNGLAKTTMECELAPFGLIRLEFLHKGNDTGYRLKVQRMHKTEALKRYMATRQHADVECLGISKLPANQHGGLLAQLLFRPPR